MYFQKLLVSTALFVAVLSFSSCKKCHTCVTLDGKKSTQYCKTESENYTQYKDRIRHIQDQGYKCGLNWAE